MTKVMNIDGLAVEVTRKNIKRINLRVKAPDGKVMVSAPYFTRDRDITEFVRSRMEWIETSIARVRSRAANSPKAASPAEKKAMREDLKRRIRERLPEIERTTGLSCSGWTVRDMHTRWGSCNTRTHHINLSLMLAARSDEELDYVILHELAHTIVPNHGPEFYAVMDRFMPGWKKIRREMNH